MENRIKLTDKVTESGRRVLEIVLGKTVFQLRFTVGAQMRLKKEFKDEPLDIVMSAVQDTEKFIAIVNEALSWNGNANPEDINGEQFYDLLVDNGVCGMNELAGVLFNIASVSGLFSEKQMNSLKNGFNQVFDKMFEQITDSERIEKAVSGDKESSFREAE
ncbi:MAG: hypothetical protein K2I14_08440 [Eubacterium sp.]|nr:hypothetical protein [Eubacterium sp.]